MTEREQPRRPRCAVRLPKSTQFVLHGIGVVLAGATLLAFADGRHWLLELLVHFRPQYLVMFAALTIAFLLSCQWRTALSYAALAAINLYFVASYYAPEQSTVVNSSPTPIRAVSVNVNFTNSEYTRMIDWIADTQPDLVLLVEVNGDWLQALTPLDAVYRHAIRIPMEAGLGIALLSKLPIEGHDAVHLADSAFPSIVARVNLRGQVLRVIGVHLAAPVSASAALQRNKQLAALATLAGSYPEPLVILGDFNITPWSRHFQRLLTGTGLIDSAHGFGLQPTWPTQFPPLWVSIDQFLHSSDVRLVARRTGDYVGSDHYPLVVDFALHTDNPPLPNQRTR